MKKSILLWVMSALVTPLALAGDKYGYYGKSSGEIVVLQLLIFLLGTFLFSVIFWWTYLWIVEDKGKLTEEEE